MKKNDITFIGSTIYFVTLSKFKIMQNGNSSDGKNFPESDIMPWDFKNDKNADGFKKHLQTLIENFRKYPPEQESSSQTEESVGNVQDSSEDVKSSSEAGMMYSPKKNAPYPCFFFKALDMNILSNLPNFQGIRIYIAGKDADELILVPIIKVNPPIEEYTQSFTADGTTYTTSTVVKLPPSPCPPLPNGMTKCP
jgi:hypothetical protein